MNFLFPIKRFIKFVLFKLSFDEFKDFNSFKSNNNKPLTSNAINDLKICCTIVESMGHTYRLSDGTILGIYRDHCLISHDNDIDIDIIYTNEINSNEFIELFKNKGYMLGRIALYRGLLQQLTFFNIKTHDIFDIVFWHKNDNKLITYCERGFKRIQEIKYFDRISIIHFEGRDYPAPSLLEEWLSIRYGNDWKTPKTIKNDWKEECYDIFNLAD
jgi:phosphorylcholine metabolism protein LicD